ncbi:MAG: hypothetical protein NVSMB52_07340 [Chloroflexota bacterium]
MRRAIQQVSRNSIYTGILGAGLVIIAEALIVLRYRPVSDFYFPLAWLGYALCLDVGIYFQTGESFWTSRRKIFFAMFPLSAAFWWLFEFFNSIVHNWVYIGAGRYTGVGFVAFATLDFSFVLLAVWNSAQAVSGLLPKASVRLPSTQKTPTRLLLSAFALGLVCLFLPFLDPEVFFGSIWLSVFLVLDPINAWLGRPSMVDAMWQRNWRLPLSFALGTLMCGFFWEAWNFWALPKWIYHIPHVGYFHIFEMPLLGWGGYLPFGLELFAMTNFVLPFFNLGTLTLHSVHPWSQPHEDDLAS